MEASDWDMLPRTTEADDREIAAWGVNSARTNAASFSLNAALRPNAPTQACRTVYSFLF
ncbi:hypothetical protein GCM10007418_22930 [Halopseudomonas salina]|uniref:Uncharacterized protein n=1 Tax=Halopseudomonas salina TaxID=1323744 RepID=A0ABQ1PTT1_9GAMM|nr:hypothetical protein GCM10007418_22930 [Halopseudomonas salina]